MGTWSPTIFGNDLAADIRSEFRLLIEDGVSGEAATAQVLASYAEASNDSDEATSFWTALAHTQWSLGRLEDATRDRTLNLIDGGGDLHLWGGSNRDLARRTAALQKLRQQLLGPQRAPVTIRKRKPIPSPASVGDVFSLRLEDSSHAYFRVLAIGEADWPSVLTIELIDEWGRPFNAIRYPDEFQPKKRPKGSELARWNVVTGKRSQLPSEGELVIVGRMKTSRRKADSYRYSGYCGWDILREAAARTMSEPSCQPLVRTGPCGRRERVVPQA